MTNDQDQQEFRVRIPWIAVAVMAMGAAAGFEYSLAEFGLLAALHAVYAMLFVYLLAWCLLEGTRGSVVVDPEKVTITDWRGRQHSIPWDSIEELRLITCGGLCPRGRIKLRANGRAYAIPNWTEEAETVVMEVISRAKLSEASRTWYHTRYLRAAQTGDQAE